MSGICVESEEKLPLTAAAPGLLQHDLLTISREEETIPKIARLGSSRFADLISRFAPERAPQPTYDFWNMFLPIHKLFVKIPLFLQ